MVGKLGLGEDERSLCEALLDWVYAVVLPERLPTADRRPFETLEEEATMLADKVRKWTREWYQDGRAQGVAEGRQDGIAHERGLLCRLASRRFGDATGRRLASVLAGVTDTVRLEKVGDLIVDCTSGEDLLRRLKGA